MRQLASQRGQCFVSKSVCPSVCFSIHSSKLLPLFVKLQSLRPCLEILHDSRNSFIGFLCRYIVIVLLLLEQEVCLTGGGSFMWTKLKILADWRLGMAIVFQ